jgi:filamentous hemagglutinin family protein
LILALALILPMRLPANPQGMTIQNGSANAVASGSTLTITAANNTHLNWQSFNIAGGESTVFQQPSGSSIVWNSIGGQSASQIYGSLQANGVVVLMNPAGFYFGPGAYVKAAGLVVSTAAAAPVESAAGAGWQFAGPPPMARVVNYGQLGAEPGGFVYLLGAGIDNHGSITAPAGNIGLCAGQTVLLSERPDGRGLSAQVTLPTGSVNNCGQLVADAGTILASAQVVNQNGIVQANSVGAANGVVEFYAADNLTLGAGSVVRADGDSSGTSPGGNITLKSAGSFADAQGSLISVAGGAAGGDGGTVEVSALEMPAILSVIDGHADHGAGGQLLLDPTDIVIGDSGGGSAGLGTVSSGSSPGTLNLDINSAFTGFSQIDLQATRNISLSAYTLWDLAASTGISDPGSLLKLEAGNNITLGYGSSILAEDGWSVTLEAGRNFLSADTVTSGTGSITFTGPAGLQTGDGDITLLAGNSVTVNSGYVRTVNGGNISVTALSGSVNAGNNPDGYDFLPVGTGYVVDPNLGGISTAAGGNVNISAGTDIISYLPVAGGVQTDAGAGCFGPAPGNVTLAAGQDISGHYVLANGIGTITAGADAGISTEPLALSLISGGWVVNAVNNILLQEVRNPNGVFNDFGSGSSILRHHFDYSPDAYTILNAGDGVALLGTALPRYSDSFESSIPSIYPPTLEITAGAGGVTLGNDVVLFPSPQGWLDITTTGGGGLTSSKSGSDPAQLILSDSGHDQYLQSGDFGINDHAAVPVHLNDDRAVELNIAGDMEGIYLVSAEQAQVNVGGDMINCRFDGQNLHAGDVTAINVAGAIQNRSEFTSVTISTAPDFTALADAYPSLAGDLANLASQFYYDANSGTLTFQGRMTTEQLQALLNLTAQEYDANGQPVFDANGNPVTIPAQFVSATALNSLYAASQDVRSDPSSGFRIGGGGTFNVTATSLDLGATAGLVSEGPAENAALANYFTRGADINVSLAGDLNMFSTTISGLNGGNISVLAGGEVNLGSTYFIGNDEFARGIFSTGDSPVSVIAGGDININGSRIAAYDGGNVTVESLHGNVAVGTGGQGLAAVEEIYVNPTTRHISAYTTTIPGSGILATTFPDSLDPAFPTSQNPVGNILVETPQGNITSTSAGIVQIPLNGSSASSGSVTLDAGTEATDGSALYLGNIDVTGGGVIGANVTLKATGNIKGTIVARNNLNINSLQTVTVDAFSPGPIVIDAKLIDDSKLITFDPITITGDVKDSQLLSPEVSSTGTIDNSELGFSPVIVANAASQGESADASAKTIAAINLTDDEDESPDLNKGGKPQLKSTGRVTVLPPK